MMRQSLTRAVIALGFGAALGLAATAGTADSAQAQTCGDFSTVLAQTDFNVNGATVGYVEILKDDCNRYVAHARLDQAPSGYAGPFNLLLMTGYPAYDQMNFGDADVASTGDVYTKPAPITTDSLLIWFNVHVTGTNVNFSALLDYDAP